MNNRERAEKIWQTLVGSNPVPMLPTPTRDIAYITAHLDEAAEEGRNEIRGACSQHQHEQYGDGFKAGYAAAREQAAVIASSVDGWHPMGKQYAIEIAETIRAMSPKPG